MKLKIVKIFLDLMTVIIDISETVLEEFEYQELCDDMANIKVHVKKLESYYNIN